MTLFVSDIINSKSSNVAGYPTPSLSWQWKRNGESIENAVASQYSVAAEDEGKIISVTQTSTSFAGTSVRTSASLGPVLPDPSSLYTQSEQGVWYDPGDFNRYMQTGPELVTNGTFVTGVTGWTAILGSISVVDGRLRVARSVDNTSAGRAITTIQCVVGKQYIFRVDRLKAQTGSTSVRVGVLANGSSVGAIVSDNGGDSSYTVTFVATQVDHYIHLESGSGTSAQYAEFDNISVRELTAISTATLFQDSSGTTPVTGVEQPVGLMLDKRLGLVQGPELLSTGVVVTAGTGSGSYNTSTGVGSATRVDVSNIGYVRFVVAANVTHLVRITNTGASELSIRDSSGTALSGSLAAGSTLDARLNPGAGAQFRVQPNINGSTINFTVNSIKELPGNHAFQSTAIDRPILRNRYNLLTKTEQFDDAAWVRQGVTVVANESVATGGAVTSDRYVESSSYELHSLGQVSGFSVSSGTTYLLSVRAKYAGRFLRLILPSSSFGVVASANFDLLAGVAHNTGGTGATIVDSGNGFYTCTIRITSAISNPTASVTITTAASSSGTGIYTGDGTSGVYIWGASLVPADQSHLPYQRVNTATDYDSDPTKFPLYLACNGANTWMRTNTIDFTSTDKVTVFAGVRKLSDAATGMLLELSADTLSNEGTFRVTAPGGGGIEKFAFATRGNGAQKNVTTESATLSAPLSAVVCGRGDIAAPLAVLRVQGAELKSSTVSQGTGNYGNHILYLFRREGTSHPFNGNFYGLIIRGNSSTQVQIELTEQWMAKRTGITLS